MTTAKEVTFVNTGTTLTATEVQGALGQVMYRLNYDRDRIGVLEVTSATRPEMDNLRRSIDVANAEIDRVDEYYAQKTNKLRMDLDFTNNQMVQLLDQVNKLSTRVSVLESKAV